MSGAVAQADPRVPLSVYASACFARRFRKPLLALGRLESRLLGPDLRETPIDRPVFITGLARGGSTILLEVLAAHAQVSTHRYRDFPFLHIPYLWNRVLDAMPAPRETPHERPHADGIFITRESPEAMEEMLWMAFFRHLHNPACDCVLGADTRNAAFESFYRDHIRKLLLVREGRRYVSKGNYLITRLAYLHALFPDARFIIPVREPVAHVTSLMRQHARFLRYGENDARLAPYLRMAGHFEFGPDARFIHTGEYAPPPGRPTLDPALWGRYWNAVYTQAIRTLEETPGLPERTLIVRHEDLCADAEGTLARVFAFCELPGADTARLAARIRMPQARPDVGDAGAAAIREETARTAHLLGYA